MPRADDYRAQVRLLLRLLPLVAEERCFALEGGTAINLFVRELPRLSVDIDLAYLPVADYQTSLHAIGEALVRIAERVRTTYLGNRAPAVDFSGYCARPALSACRSAPARSAPAR